MKRVFAFISLFAIALVMFGFGTTVKAAEPAEGKWFENPYLLTDDEGNVVEIPMYIMNSITTTFPDHFDYEGAKGTEYEDKNWGGSVRQYAWNGVKVVIPQYNAEGATGQYYGIYPQGASKGGQIGIGGYIYTTTGTYDKGSFYKGGSYVRTAPGDPSLSFYLFNDQEADWSMVDINKANAANPYIIFDGAGKAVAGVMLPDTSKNAVEAAYGLGQEFCWDENGVGVVANADASNCARVLVDGEEDDLDKPILDENGEPTGEYEKVQVPGEDPNYVTYRFVWMHMEEKPANLNNNYLGEGWKADNWDFYNEETKVAVAILGSAFNYGGGMSGAELAADESDADGVRAPFNATVIPAGGLLYKFGYLERTSTLLPLYKEVQAQAYLYGREEGYAQTVKCHNYAASDIEYTDTVLDGMGLSLIEGTNTIEVVAGTQIDFDKLIDLTGVSYCFTDENDPFSFTSSVMTEDDFAAKKAAFVEAEKALLREEVAYETYQSWLDEQAAKEAGLKQAVADAKTALDNAKANKVALEDAAEQAILASEKDTIVNEYKQLLKTIELAEAAIEDKKAEIAKLEKAYEIAKTAYEASTISHRDTLQYQGYNTSLSDAKAAHDAQLAILTSYVALGLGNEGITIADVAVKAEQDKVFEDWKITFANAELQAAKAAFIAAIGTADEETARAALVAAFKVDSNDTFAPEYAAVVNEFIDLLVDLNIANIAMHDYVEECLENTVSLKEQMLAAEKAVVDAKAELGAAKTDKEAATGLYLALEEAEADRVAYIAKYLAGDADYAKACKAVEEAQAKYDAAVAELGNPTIVDDKNTKEDESKAATGYYAEYEKTVNEVEANITAVAKERAEKVFEEWKANEYADEIALEYNVTVDGKLEVFKSPYKNKDEFLTAFFTDFYNFLIEKGTVTTAQCANVQLFMHSSATAKDYAGYYTGLAGASTFQPFLTDKDVAVKWESAINYFTRIRKGNDLWASPWGTYSVMFKNYCQGKTHASYGPVTPEEAAGYPVPTKYEDYVLPVSTVINDVTYVTVNVKSPILGLSSTIDLEFVAVEDVYDVTPIIEVNAAQLYVTDPSTFNVRTIATAYDRVYSESCGIKGNDISSQINFVCPELDAALASGVVSGEFPVEMTVYNRNGRKAVTETAVVKFVDTVAPVLQARDVTINYGEDFHYLDGIYFAYDNVEGNLFEADYFAFAAEQDTVNCYKPGEYTVKVSAMDKSGNSREVEYTVTVNEQEVVLDEVLDAIEDVNTAVKDSEEAVSDKVDGSKDEVIAGQDQIKDGVQGATDAAADNTLVVVATVLAGVAALASVGAVVLVVLKKK
ncbi:MAG: hypothetical protein IJX78_03635 [Bacilli bacterium]|nr:hypothetical protein [Bacilli bacterium]